MAEPRLPVIDNIVLACPGATDESYAREGRALATFYAELLGMHLLREDWFLIAPSLDSGPRLAFGDGPIAQWRPPRWPDPDHPQQLHLDLAVADLDLAERFVLDRSAVRLQERDGFRSYADPVGHPFCLYLDPARQPGSGPVAELRRVVVDCSSPRALAAFWSALLDLPRREVDTTERVVITRADGAGPALAFQQATFAAPRWGDPAYPQQLHLDIWVTDADEAGQQAVRLGAVRLPDLGGSCPVYADPAGHPFCLCTAGE